MFFSRKKVADAHPIYKQRVRGSLENGIFFLKSVFHEALILLFL
ncbi:hypothetical protein O176_00495 [Chlamydia trachomatis]|nr:hypothetical protein O169_00495 [Chlamydia trachomatis]AGT67631.1 hypothetical protein O173_00495 [Chlamydia trachomatis F/11-96]AHC17749.1 hypothetical protein CTW3_00490 [Chlamydia trachomatis C/TW-3]AKR33063.1 hypothetical protein DCS63711_00490 [Chlamydia trachomatis D/CS637/11]AGT65776.1 hypothetical protein O170_00495 [Chlamydia trachomatis]